MAGLSISSALWLSAMAANPVGAKLAGELGVAITFGSWLRAAAVPSLAALGIVPYVLFRVMAPTVRRTPEAPRLAREALAKMGRVTRTEWITAGAFGLMIVAWALPASVGVDRTAVALGGLGLVMVSGIYTVRDLAREGEALEIWIWFAVLYTLSTKLNELGFMGWIAEASAGWLRGLGPTLVGLLLVLWYVALHYLFVSQSAHLLALFGVFLGVAKDCGANVPLMAYLLLFATNFFSCLTPQGSSANVLFAGSGYLTSSELYKHGALVTLVNAAIYLTVGTAWLWLVL
jgi:DASS family divalent anion:Na+ symporter